MVYLQKVLPLALEPGLGFGVQGSGFRVWGSGSRVWGSGLRVWGLGCRVEGSGLRDAGFGFWVWCFRAYDHRVLLPIRTAFQHRHQRLPPKGSAFSAEVSMDTLVSASTGFRRSVQVMVPPFRLITWTTDALRSSERRGNTLKHSIDFCRKAQARIWS